MIGGKAPGGSGRNAVAPAEELERTIASAAAPASAGPAASTSRRPGAIGTSRSSGIATHTIASALRSATLAANSVVVGAIRTDASSPSETAYTSRAEGERGAVFGSVIMKKRNTSTSGEVISTDQRWKPEIGPRCQRAVIECPASARMPMPTANDAQKPSATRSRCSRRRMAKPPLTMTTSASTSHADIGPHQKSSGAARFRPSARKQMTRPMFDGLKMCSPFQRSTCFERSEIAAVPTKIHQPRRLHQSPCAVPGTRRTNATPLPVSIALAGHMITRWLRKAIATSSTAHVPRASRICAIESWKWKPTCPITWSDVIVAARCRRGSRSFGRRTGYGVPRIRMEGAVALKAASILVS